MSKYTVLADVLRDGRRYVAGDEIDLEAADAAGLLAGRWIAVNPALVNPALVDPAPADPAPKQTTKGKK